MQKLACYLVFYGAFGEMKYFCQVLVAQATSLKLKFVHC